MEGMKKLFFSAIIVHFFTHSRSYESLCGSVKLECADGRKCILPSQLCNYNADCDDASDEMNFELCKKLNYHKKNCNSENFKIRCAPNYSNRDYYDYSGNCNDLLTACQYGRKCLSQDDMIICQSIADNKLKPVKTMREEPTVTKETQYENYYTMLEFITDALNETKQRNFSTCPPFFTPFDEECFSFFSPAQITWSEAKLFCESISGRLAVLDDINKYVNVLDYIKLHEIKSNYWIGGYLEKSVKEEDQEPEREWIWLDGSSVEVGAPFWSLSFNSSTNHDSSCLNPKKSLKPSYSVGERCIAILGENFYYFSDELCDERFAPLCIADELE